MYSRFYLVVCDYTLSGKVSVKNDRSYPLLALACANPLGIIFLLLQALHRRHHNSEFHVRHKIRHPHPIQKMRNTLLTLSRYSVELRCTLWGLYYFGRYLRIKAQLPPQTLWFVGAVPFYAFYSAALIRSFPLFISSL